MLGALSGGSWVWLLQLEGCWTEGSLFGLPCGGRALCSPKASAELCTSGKKEALRTRAAVFLQRLLTRQ